MFRNSFVAIGTAARTLWRNMGALALFNALYAALLFALYAFISTKEATRWQLALTALFALAAPILFFVLQAAGVNYAGGEAASFGSLLRRALKSFWKLLLVSLPLIALAVLVVYLLNKLQVRFPLPTEAEAARPALTTPAYPAGPPPMPLRWQNIIFPTLRLLLLGFALPLAAIHLWISVAHEGFGRTLKGLHRVFARAFSVQSVVIYAVGLFVFALIPYILVFTRTPVSNAWGELILFGIRLALAFVFTLWGWVITLGALTRNTFDAGATPHPDTAAQAVRVEEAAA